jgi:hypothetical protein
MAAPVAVFNETNSTLSVEWDDREIYNDVRSEIDITTETVITEPGTDPVYQTYLRSQRFSGTMAIGATRDVTITALPEHLSPTWLSAEADASGTDYDDPNNYKLPASLLSTSGSSAVYRVTNNTATSVNPFALNAWYQYTVTPAHDGTSHTDTGQQTITVRATDATSIAKYGRRTMNLTWPMGQTQEQMTALVNSYVAKYAEPVARLTMTVQGDSDTNIVEILTRKVSDKIEIICAALGLDGNFWIDSVAIGHNVFGVIEATWVCEQVRSSEESELFVADTSELDGAAILAY